MLNFAAMKRKIYVASSSWTSQAAEPSGRNEFFPDVVNGLREAGWFAGSGKKMEADRTKI